MGFEPVQTACNKLNDATELSHATFLGNGLTLPKELLF